MKEGKAEIGIRLKDLREKRGLSVFELSEILGVTRMAINYWERSERIPREQTLKKYSDYFNVSIDWIKNGDLTEYIYKILIKNDNRIKENTKKIEKIKNIELKSEENKKQISDLMLKNARLFTSCQFCSELIEKEWNKEDYPSEEEVLKLYNRISLGQDLSDYISFILIKLHSMKSNLLHRLLSEELSSYQNEELNSLIASVDNAIKHSELLYNSLLSETDNTHRDEED